MLDEARLKRWVRWILYIVFSGALLAFLIYTWPFGPMLFGGLIGIPLFVLLCQWAFSD